MQEYDSQQKEYEKGYTGLDIISARSFDEEDVFEVSNYEGDKLHQHPEPGVHVFIPRDQLPEETGSLTVHIEIRRAESASAHRKASSEASQQADDGPAQANQQSKQYIFDVPFYKILPTLLILLALLGVIVTLMEMSISSYLTNQVGVPDVPDDIYYMLQQDIQQHLWMWGGIGTIAVHVALLFFSFIAFSDVADLAEGKAAKFASILVLILAVGFPIAVSTFIQSLWVYNLVFAASMAIFGSVIYFTNKSAGKLVL